MRIPATIVATSVMLCLACFEMTAQVISATVIQTGNPVISVNSINNPILKIEMVVGTSTQIAQFTFSTAGSTWATVDISNAKLWFNDSAAVFDISTATLLGTYSQPPGAGYFTFLTAPTANYYGLSSFSGLNAGTNCFYLTYNIPPGAVPCDTVDATSASFNANSVTLFPLPASPAGYSVIDGCPTGIETDNESASINIYPVPASDNINILVKTNSKSLLSIDLLDLHGRLINPVWSAVPLNTLTKIDYPLINLSPGIYIIRSSFDDLVKINRIVKL